MILLAAREQCGLSVCGWCGEWLEVRADLSVGEVSHGMCEPCQAREFSILDGVDGINTSTTAFGRTSLSASGTIAHRSAGAKSARSSSSPVGVCATTRQGALFAEVTGG